MSTPPLALERDIYTVSRLNRMMHNWLEGSFPAVWLEGEISNLARPASGHLYFSLKDEKAQIRCVLFRHRAQLLRVKPDNGQHVLVRAKISLYEPRGDFQLIVESVEDTGDGALRRAYEVLRLRLDREGLFAAERKRPLPRFPRRIGVITSPSGAAIRDVLNVLKRRFPALPILLYPVPVQGEGAGEQIARTIDLASRRRDCDVLLLVRGGGSLEDLWAFNEEKVARAMAACAIPIICGVGHEIDVTIADFTADLRAPTPSAAAELVSPDRLQWLHQFISVEERLETAMRQQLERGRQTLTWLERGLLSQHPDRRLRNWAQRLDELEQRLLQAVKINSERLGNRTAGLTTRLYAQTPVSSIHRLQERQQALNWRLETAVRQQLEKATQRLANLGYALHTVSPLQTLQRGYAIVRRYPQGEIIRRSRQLQLDEQIDVLLGEGSIVCQVKKIQDRGIGK